MRRRSTIGGDMDRGADGDSRHASCRARNAPSGSCDHADHGFSSRVRTRRRSKQHAGDFAVGRIIKPSVKGTQRQDEPVSASLRTARRDWDQGCGRSSRARAGSRRSHGSRRTGRAARGRRAARMPASSTWTRNTVPRCSMRCSAPSAATLESSRERRKLEAWIGEVSRKPRQGDHAWQGVRRP